MSEQKNAQKPKGEAKCNEQGEVVGIKAPIYLNYNFTAGAAAARFLQQVKKGVLTGQRCPKCQQVYIPPRGACAACGVATQEEVKLSDKATVQSFTIVSILTICGS